jgi:hypothetical protein
MAGNRQFASPTTGLKIYNSSGVGRLSTYNAGLEQITMNTAGQLTGTTSDDNRIVVSSGGSVSTLAASSIALTAPSIRMPNRQREGVRRPCHWRPNLDPLTGVLLMKERTAATGATPADAAQIWVQDAAGVQKLYIKFANGVQRELATA